MSLSSKSRTLSVYGGAGGRGTRISSVRSGGLYASPRGFNLADGLDVSADEKGTMQNLNNRLASYLGKVRSLERSNAELEEKIKDWYESHRRVEFDHSGFLTTIEDLREKIYVLSKHNGKIILNIDNTKLAADDFKTKYENELAMRKAVEDDMVSLKIFLDESSLRRSDLELEYEGLQEELIYLRKSHEEEMALARVEAGGQVNVCVDAAPSTDLNLAMTEIRGHYEAVTEKNRKDLESWYQNKVTTAQQKVVTHNEDLQTSRTQLKDLASMLQRLQIDLQTHQNMVTSEKGILDETEARYGAHLANLQVTVTGLEDQLSLLHANIANTKQEYDTLLDIKTRLELEITEYRRLLDGEGSKKRNVVTKTITVMETFVDGKNVSSEMLNVDEIITQNNI